MLGPQIMEHILGRLGKGAGKASIWPPPRASKFGFQEGPPFDAIVLCTKASNVSFCGTLSGPCPI